MPVHVDDIGTRLEVTIFEKGAVADLVDMGVTAQNIRLRAPDGTETIHAATFSSDGRDGRIEYTTASGDFTGPGIWEMAGQVIVGANQYTADASAFVVTA